MRILKFSFILVIVLCGVFFIGGCIIQDKWMVSRSITIRADAAQIYPYISHFKEWPKWAPWSASADASLKYSYEGADGEVGAKQSWTSEKMGTGWMKIVSVTPPTDIDYKLSMDMNGSHCTLHGNINLSPDEQGTKVTWTDSGNSGNGFIKRWMSLLLKPMLGKDLDQGLSSLKQLVEEGGTRSN